MRVLVTGGAGFIGSHTVDALLQEGHTVRILDSLDPQVHEGGRVPPYLDARAELMRGDVRDPVAVREAIRDMDAVLYLAAAVGVGQSMYQIRHYVDVNAVGAATLLEALVDGRHSIRRMVVASSMSAYGEGAYHCAACGDVRVVARPVEQIAMRRWEAECPTCGGVLTPRPTSERVPFQPTSVYAVTKRDHEELFLSVGGAYGIPTVALRYFNAYGPRQALSNPYTGVIAIFSSRLLNGEPPVVFEDGGQARDFVHVDDVVQANLLALFRSDVDGEVLNVGTGRPTAVIDLARKLAEILGVDLEPRVENRFRAGDIRHCFADISRIREVLGYEPRVALDDGLRGLAGWLRQQMAEDKVELATAELEGRGLLR